MTDQTAQTAQTAQPLPETKGGGLRLLDLIVILIEVAGVAGFVYVAMWLMGDCYSFTVAGYKLSCCPFSCG